MLRVLPLLLALAFATGCSSTRYDRSGRSYPASARVSTQGGQARYVLCHKGKKTMTLPAAAVDAHRRHGDRFGACARGDRRGKNDGKSKNKRNR